MDCLIIPCGWKAPIGQIALDQCLESVAKLRPAFDWPVVLCWDFVPDRTISAFEEKYPFIISLINYGNRLYFTKNANRGLRYAHKHGMSALLVNQDCILPKEIRYIKGEGLRTPYTVPTVEEMDKANAYIEQIGMGAGEVDSLNNFPFFCPYIHKNVMDEIGFLDDRAFKASFEDDDYIVRARLAGFKVQNVNVAIVHQGSHIDQMATGQSFSGVYTIDDLGIMQDRFLWKWGIKLDDPGMRLHDGTPNHSMYQEWILNHYKWNKEKMYCG